CSVPLIATAADFGGTWSGPYTLAGASGELRITIAHVGTAVMARAEAESFSSGPVVGAIEDGQLHFAFLANGYVVDFRGRVDGDRIIASLASNGHGGSAVLTHQTPVITANVD